MANGVELHPIYIWDCPGCGHENIKRIPTLSDGTKPWPEWVACRRCEATFQVVKEGGDDDQLQHALSTRR